MKRLSQIFCIVFLFLFFSFCENKEMNLTDEGIATSHVLKALNANDFALGFDGEDDYVMVQDNPSLDITNQFTIVAWVRINEYVEWASFVTKGEDMNNYTIHQSGPDGESEIGHLRFTANSETNLPKFLESETQIPLNEWHFVSVTWDGNEIKFYLDGYPDGGGSFQGPVVPNDQPLFIGADFPGAAEFWNGMIDEVRIWNEALSPRLVMAAMHGYSVPMAKALVGCWSFSEGEGVVVNDRSKYINHGSLVGDPAWVESGR